MVQCIKYDKKFCQGTIGFGIALVALIIPVSLIVAGYCYIHECPAQSGLPEWMIYYGILILIVCLAKAVQVYLDEEVGREGIDLSFIWGFVRLVLWIVLILMHLIGIWLVFYVWSIEDAVCNYYFQLFALFMLILTTVIGVVGLSLKCCGTWFAIAELTNFFHDSYIDPAKP
ncbi:hypothetical protein WR25_08042 [Diploscapter pachys]|uniref:Transmembrane protein n=1 Tax=Diploscapter pachys TaxID=2018661 RepID=A0A2A2JDX2_9BILA|nr:hypothetical protein WR25_08042 [Diploscapter pachys]